MLVLDLLPAAIGEPVNKPGTDGEAEIHVEQLSYFSSLADASTFIERAAGEMRRRSVMQAKQVCRHGRSRVVSGVCWPIST